MAMAAVWIAPDTGAHPATEERVTALLHRYAPAGGQLQHLRVRAGPSGLVDQMVVFGFVMADTSEQARKTLRAIAETTIAAEPELHHWRVV